MIHAAEPHARGGKGKSRGSAAASGPIPAQHTASAATPARAEQPVVSDRLTSFAVRIHRLMDEKAGIAEDIGDVYLEAKSAGYVPKVLRKAITRQRMDPDKRQEEDSILGLYEAALDGPTREAVKLAAQGASARQIERATGIDQATVARSVSLKKKRETPPHDIETGEIEVPPPADGLRGGPGLTEKGTTESCGGVESRHAATNPSEPLTTALNGDASHPNNSGPVRDSAAGVAPGPQDPSSPTPEQDAERRGPPEAKPSTTESDGLEIPEFLRRKHELSSLRR